MSRTLDRDDVVPTPAPPSPRGVGTTPALVSLNDITKSYGATRALSGVSLEVVAGRSHALVGRNGAGKSTLVKIMTGLQAPDAGSLQFSGEQAPSLADRRAWASRVACVHQRSMVVPHLTVLENLMLDAVAQGSRRVPWRRLRREAEELREQWALGTSLDTRVQELTVGERQLLEIARALRGGSRLILMDEPTAQLQSREIEVLFQHMRRLQAEGVTFLYISHHLSEIYEVCDDVTVLRDGRHVTTAQVERLPHDRLVEAMLGPATPTRAATRAPEARAALQPGAGDRGEPVLEVRALGGDGFDSVSLEVRRGEKVGVAGIAGCGKVELAATIAGLRPPVAGEVMASGRRTRPGRVDDAVAAGIGYVPEDRHANGFCANLSIEENIAASVLGRVSGRAGLVSRRRRAEVAQRLFDQLQIKASSPSQLAGELSGGNQQKVVVGRALASDPDVLVMATPTAGIDIAARELLFDLIRTSECGVLLVSDDLEELALCDRILVMFDGTLRGELPADVSDDLLVAAMEGVEL